MKFLLILGVILFAVWLWRHNRRTREVQRPDTPATVRKPPAPTHMVACLHCGVHLAEQDAVHGRLGDYCGQPHRQAHEG